MKKALAALATLTAIFAIALALPLTTNASGTQGLLAPSAPKAKVDPLLQSFLSTNLTAPVVITYKQKPGNAEFDRLRAVGIREGFALRELPMVIADMNLAQLASVRGQAGVLSIWGNRAMKIYLNESRRFIGVPQMMADRDISSRNANNPGFPVSGKGVGIGYIDTGIDATHEDLKYGRKTVQNVIQPLAQGVVSDFGQFDLFYISISDIINDAAPGFIPPIYVENVPSSDLESGHGTHGAGVAAGTGATSGGFYSGVAVGAHLVGIDTGDDKGLPLVAILTAYDYLMVNQFAHNIRVINNSWGSGYSESEIDPANPINVATRRAHDLNITVVFAAGNSGDTETAINPYSTMPWTISAAAGEKNGLGTPASFSSRGRDNGDGVDVAGQPADETARPNLRPDVTAPGVRITSARAHAPAPFMNALSALNNDPQNVPPAFLPSYYSVDGTSFACPHTSGVVALMLEANPTLTPDDVVTILRQTANPMPYEERVVGAGYVDAHNAVRRALGLPAVAHPFDLFPTETDGPEIVDASGDAVGTDAQDILAGDFAYDAANDQMVYTLTLTDLSLRAANAGWVMSSNFGPITVFVNARINETNAVTFTYGTVAPDPNTGLVTQTTIGPADSGEIRGNQVIVRLAIGKINTAVGSNVVGATSTATQAKAQILIGASAAPRGLLLNADNAGGKDFKVE